MDLWRSRCNVSRSPRKTTGSPKNRTIFVTNGLPYAALRKNFVKLTNSATW